MHPGENPGGESAHVLYHKNSGMKLIPLANVKICGRTNSVHKFFVSTLFVDFVHIFVMLFHSSGKYVQTIEPLQRDWRSPNEEDFEKNAKTPETRKNSNLYKFEAQKIEMRFWMLSANKIPLYLLSCSNISTFFIATNIQI